MQQITGKYGSSNPTLLILAGAGAIAWIVLATLFRHEGDADPRPVQLALSGLALWYVVCGIWTVRRRMTPDTRLFFYACMLAGVHWGGPIGIGPEGVQIIQLGIFILLSTVLGEAVFFDLARIAKTFNTVKRRWIIYTPFALGVALLILLGLRPTSQLLLDAVFNLYTVGVIVGFAAAAVWLFRLFARNEQDKKGISIVLFSLLLGAAPDTLNSINVIGSSAFDGLLNLPLALFPMSLAWFLTDRVFAGEQITAQDH